MSDDPTVLLFMAAFVVVVVLVQKFVWFPEINTTKPPPAVEEPIVAGSVWSFKGHDSSPWPSSKSWRVRVLDARDGWVRYYQNSTFPDERNTEDSFRMMYELYENKREEPAPKTLNTNGTE